MTFCYSTLCNFFIFIRKHSFLRCNNYHTCMNVYYITGSTMPVWPRDLVQRPQLATAQRLHPNMPLLRNVLTVMALTALSSLVRTTTSLSLTSVVTTAIVGQTYNYVWYTYIKTCIVRSTKIIFIWPISQSAVIFNFHLEIKIYVEDLSTRALQKNKNSLALNIFYNEIRDYLWLIHHKQFSFGCLHDNSTAY